MKRFLKSGGALLLICSILVSCSSKNVQERNTSQHANASPASGQEEQKIEKGTPEYDMLQIEKSVDTNDNSLFMSYQNQENTLFYKEQKRWIEEVAFKKNQGYKVSIKLFSFHQVNDHSGTVNFSVMMSHPKLGGTTNTVTYQMIKVNDKWTLNDLPFQNLATTTGLVTVFYLRGQEDAAQKTLQDASDIVNFYSSMFNWKPEPITIKIYSSSPEVSATVPWIGLGGWNEMGESIKITTDQSNKILRYLAHELTHKMLGDITHDNATIYIQEGFATYLEGTIIRDKSGNVTYDPTTATQQVAKAIEIKKSVKTIAELGAIDYSDPEMSMYRDGFLWANYFIQTKGLPTFFNMLHYLSKFEYVDDRAEHKIDTSQVRTLEAIEKTYGPVDKLSADCKNYYLNGK